MVTKRPNYLKLYGEFWNPDIIYWGEQGAGNKGKLWGEVKADSGEKRKVDFWDAKGLYALYDNFKPVYIGKAISGEQGCIGKRIRDHLSDRLAGRWDMFSWYSLSSFREHTLTAPGSRQLTPEVIAKALEALAIALISPPLNRKRNELPDSKIVFQATKSQPYSIRKYLEKILAKVSQKPKKKGQ